MSCRRSIPLLVPTAALLLCAQARALPDNCSSSIRTGGDCGLHNVVTWLEALAAILAIILIGVSALAWSIYRRNKKRELKPE